MRNFLKVIYFLFSIVFLFYLSLPSPSFPRPLTDAIQSNEPADTESPLRRGYYTNSTREEALRHYEAQFQQSSFFGIPLPTYRLNYPPEEAQTLIRDQARSTFLEEIVHPFRESIFVNGFEPTRPQDAIFIEGRTWRQKIIIKFVPSTTFVRLALGATVLIFIPLIYGELKWILRKYD